MSTIRKFLVALGTACTLAAADLADGTLTTTEGIEIMLAFLGAVGVYAVRNE